MNELQKQFSYRSLKGFYSEHRPKFRNSPTAGVDGVGFVDFDKQADSNIHRISNQVRQGSYNYSHLKPIPLDKADGDVRWICVPTMSDRLVQRRIVDAVVRLYGDKLRTKFSFGSLKHIEGESDATKLAAELRNSNPWCIKADISKFFDTVSRDKIKTKIDRTARHASLRSLIYNAVKCEAFSNDPSVRKEMAKAGLRTGIGLRQGMPLSPLLAHIYLLELDRWTDAQDTIVLRYVDDFLVLGKSKTEVLSCYNHIQERAISLGLKIHRLGESEKTKLVYPRQPVDFLGIEIFREPSGQYYRRIPKSAFERLKDRVGKKLDVDPSKYTDRHIIKAVEYIGSMRRNYHAVYRDMANWPIFYREVQNQERRAIKLFRKHISSIPRSPNTKILRAFGIR